MRKAGTIPDREQAELFLDHLLVLGIQAQAEEEEGQWGIWILEEDHVSRGRQELEHFLQEPSAPGYQAAQEVARGLRMAAHRREKLRRKRVVDMRQRWSAGLARRAPVTFFCIVASIVVAVLTRLGEDESFVDPLRIVSIHRFGREAFGFTDLREIRSGEVWRLITPIFLHFGIIHLLFNMLWLYYLGGAIEVLRGRRRMALLVLALAVIPNLAEFGLLPLLGLGEYHPNFGGMSGVVYGLFGYAWMKSRFEPGLGLYVHPNTVAIMLIWFLLAMSGVFGGIANLAHGAGLVVGAGTGYASVFWRRLRKG